MWIEAIAFFLGVAILLYCLFAGADFGAGILEAFRGPRRREAQQELITHAISPVWEANHVWVVLAVVILFVGFPAAYARLSVVLHIPLTLMLLGIVLRGCAFTFRHYDAVKDRSQAAYSAIFVISSFVTPLMLGTIAGAVFLGRFPALDGASFTDAFVHPWFNLFSLSVGLFASVLFTFLAAVYLIGETAEPELKQIFVARARAANLAALVIGAWVFVAAEIDGLNLVHAFTSDALALACLVSATFLLGPLWWCVTRSSIHRARLCVGTQVSLILMGWLKLQLPALVVSRLPGVASITIYSAAAPAATLAPLLWALVVGSALIFPALLYLLIIFKRGAR